MRERMSVLPSQSACASMQRTATAAVMVLQNPDSLTRIVPTRVSARLCARIRDKIDGAPTAPRQDFPRVTGPLYFLVTTPASFFLYFLLSASFSRILRATGREAAFVFLSSVRIPLFFLFFSFVFFLLIYPPFSSYHRVGCFSGPIRETRHDSDISLEVARGRVDH